MRVARLFFFLALSALLGACQTTAPWERFPPSDTQAHSQASVGTALLHLNVSAMRLSTPHPVDFSFLNLSEMMPGSCPEALVARRPASSFSGEPFMSLAARELSFHGQVEILFERSFSSPRFGSFDFDIARDFSLSRRISLDGSSSIEMPSARAIRARALALSERPDDLFLQLEVDWSLLSDSTSPQADGSAPYFLRALTHPGDTLILIHSLRPDPSSARPHRFELLLISAQSIS